MMTSLVVVVMIMSCFRLHLKKLFQNLLIPIKWPGLGAPSVLRQLPGPVLVPSTRTSTPFSGQMPVGYGTPQTGQINPYSLSEMQRYQQMLARLGQSKSPIGLAERWFCFGCSSRKVFGVVNSGIGQWNRNI